MKKSKAQDIDLFYLGEEEKKKKNKKVAGKNKPASKKKKNEKSENNDDIFRFDDEIVIGITKIEDKSKDKKEKKKKEKEQKQDKKHKEQKIKDQNKKRKEQIATNQKQNKKNKSQNIKEQTQNKKRKTQNEKNQTKNSKKNKKIVTVAKYSFLTILLLGTILYFMLSPVFNIKKITVKNNQLISEEEIISLSRITIEENTFKIRLGQVEKNIKENAYIESAKISRKLPSEIQIEVVERVPTYMLEFINSVVYINNQGYMLDVTETKLDVPIIVGYTTPAEEIKAGSRLCKEDLLKLEMVLKIMETANNYEIGSLITKIGIADKNNYTLYLEGEKKTVYLGDASNINTRIMYLKEIIELEKGIESEVFINGDINKDDVYTREKV